MDGSTGNLLLGNTNELYTSFVPFSISHHLSVDEICSFRFLLLMLKRIMSEKNLYENEDPIWRIHMQTLMRKKRNMEIAQTIDDALYEYYSELGRPVPRWKKRKI